MVIKLPFNDTTKVAIVVDNGEISDYFDSDKVTLEEVLAKIVDFGCKIHQLEEKIYYLEHPDDGSDQEFERWRDRNL